MGDPKRVATEPRAATPPRTTTKNPGKIRVAEPQPITNNTRLAPGLVGARLRQRRMERGISLRQFARDIEVSASFISQLETGKAQPSVATFFSICAALDISTDELFNYDDSIESTRENASNGPTATGACVNNGSKVACAAGDANLDFLSGAEATFQQSKQQQNALRGWIPSLYVQDTFHATQRLTVVAGVRWVPEFYPHDFFNRGTTFDFAAFMANKVSGVFSNAPAGTFFYGDPGISNKFTKDTPWQFSPNIGLSFDPTGTGKTVFRAGFEVAYDEVNYFNAQRNEQNPPYATASNPNTTGQLCFSQPWLLGGTGVGCAQVGGADTSPYPTPQIPTPATAIFPAQSQYIVMTPQFHPTETVQCAA